MSSGGGGGEAEKGKEKKEEEEEEERNWAELPHDVLSVIFKKAGAVEILMNAQLVCRPWRNLSLDPSIWKTMTCPGDGNDVEGMTKEAVIGAKANWRTSNLRCLRLISAYGISDEGLCEAVGQLPQLEELDITFGSYSERVCEYVGKACPHLKCFHLNKQGNRYDQFESDEEALGIANNMPELRQLQLVGNKLTNKGLSEIVDRCIHLEHLDLRCCFRVNLDSDANLKAKCARIKELRLPYDSTHDYGFMAECEWDGYFDGEDDYYPSGYSDIELMYDDLFLDYSDISEDGYDIF
ncbi:uncharacterized protein A4U43_C06F30 [Asparagus officinalis]|uniref:F-box domain-containing protein n=1 Tax=Asparagus officinalis TaxID=4686 RepID=A0A5P1ELN0_ASPOF|nr:uncharacterized protein A4U43_C06F30 [Asparagus officinalis]